MSDHTETVDIEFDSSQVTFESLLERFWKSHNPISSHSRQYMSAIFYHSEQQKESAEKSRDEQQKHLVQPIKTLITPALTFYNAEDYHQKYMLRQHPTVLEKLGLSDKEIIQSTVAAKLNGYLSGNGTEEQFQQDCKEGIIQLTEAVAAYVLRTIKKRSRF